MLTIRIVESGYIVFYYVSVNIFVGCAVPKMVHEILSEKIGEYLKY